VVLAFKDRPRVRLVTPPVRRSGLGLQAEGPDESYREDEQEERGHSNNVRVARNGCHNGCHIVPPCWFIERSVLPSASKRGTLGPSVGRGHRPSVCLNKKRSGPSPERSEHRPATPPGAGFFPSQSGRPTCEAEPYQQGTASINVPHGRGRRIVGRRPCLTSCSPRQNAFGINARRINGVGARPLRSARMSCGTSRKWHVRAEILAPRPAGEPSPSLAGG
jgi:hypothetical protein